jgi:hypothetical protein
MSNDKALAVIPRTLPEIQTMAEILAKSTLLPDALRGKVPDVVVQILAGQELGLAPMASIRGVHIVAGKPILSADTMVALVLGSGLCDYFSRVEETATSVTYECKRRGAPHPQRFTWSDEDSKRAGLNTKENYRLHGRAMRAARAKAALARDVFPDILMGAYDPDEFTSGPESRPTESRAAAPVEHIEDAEIVENPAAEWVDKIKATDSEAACKALAKEIAASGLTNGAQVEVNNAYKARLAELRAKPAEATS